jgi:uncharacterized protein (DUF58 family)
VPTGWAGHLAALARRHEVVAVRLSDPREAHLPDIGIVTFEDPETGAQLTVDTADARLRERFRQAAASQAAAIDRALAAAGAEVVSVGTDQSLLGAMAGFLDARRRATQVPVA